MALMFKVTQVTNPILSVLSNIFFFLLCFSVPEVYDKTTLSILVRSVPSSETWTLSKGKAATSCHL